MIILKCADLHCLELRFVIVLNNSLSLFYTCPCKSSLSVLRGNLTYRTAFTTFILLIMKLRLREFIATCTVDVKTKVSDFVSCKSALPTGPPSLHPSLFWTRVIACDLSGSMLCQVQSSCFAPAETTSPLPRTSPDTWSPRQRRP